MDIPKATQVYPFYAKNMDIQKALSLFGKNLNIAVNIDKNIKGKIVSDLGRKLSRRQYLDALSQKFGFLWYFDGIVLNISDVNSIKTEIISLTKKDAVLALELLVNIGIYQEKFMHRVDEKSSVFMVSGPERYVDLVKASLKSIEDSNTKPISVIRGAIGAADITAAPDPAGPNIITPVSSGPNVDASAFK